MIERSSSLIITDVAAIYYFWHLPFVCAFTEIGIGANFFYKKNSLLTFIVIVMNLSGTKNLFTVNFMFYKINLLKTP